jgi:hypothetical protein
VAEIYYRDAKDLEYGQEAEVILVQRHHGRHGDEVALHHDEPITHPHGGQRVEQRGSNQPSCYFNKFKKILFKHKITKQAITIEILF